LELLFLVMFYLAVKPSHVEVDVDGLAYSLHHPRICSRQRGGQSFLTGSIPSCHATVDGGAFPGDAKPSGLNILRGVDRTGICKTESYMEKLAFIEGMFI
jgi:hypothetical protein